MPKLSQEFMDIINGVAEEYRTAEAQSNWMPPDGSYTVVLTKYTNGVKTGENKFAWFKMEGRIDAPNNPEVHDKSFSVGFATTKYPGLLKTFVSSIAGAPVDNIGEIDAILEAAQGKIATVTVTTKTNKKTGNPVRNVDIESVIA